MTFSITPLVSGGYLVEGTDGKGVDGTTVLRSEKWDAVKYTRAWDLATDEFNKVVEEFFAPLTEAADAAKTKVTPPQVAWNQVTITEGTEGTESKVITLDEHGVLLRLIEEGHDDKLRWVNGDLVAIV